MAIPIAAAPEAAPAPTQEVETPTPATPETSEDTVPTGKAEPAPTAQRADTTELADTKSADTATATAESSEPEAAEPEAAEPEAAATPAGSTEPAPR